RREWFSYTAVPFSWLRTNLKPKGWRNLWGTVAPGCLKTCSYFLLSGTCGFAPPTDRTPPYALMRRTHSRSASLVELPVLAIGSPEPSYESNVDLSLVAGHRRPYTTLDTEVNLKNTRRHLLCLNIHVESTWCIGHNTFASIPTLG